MLLLKVIVICESQFVIGGYFNYFLKVLHKTKYWSFNFHLQYL